VENTVGFFSSVVYVRVRLQEADTLADVLKHVVADYWQSYAIPDFCYLGAELPRPELSNTSSFNWIPKPQGAHQLLSAADSITSEEVAFEHPFLEVMEQDPDPGLMFQEFADEVYGSVIFSNRRYSKDMMERLLGNFVEFLKTMLTKPEIRVKDIPLI
jgi:hypothetical protein